MSPYALKRLAIASVALALLVPLMLSAMFLTQGDTTAAALPVTHRERVALKPPVAPPVPPVAAPAAPTPPRVASVITRPDSFDYGASVWNGDAARAGPVVITVDLQSQLLRVFRGGHEIGVSTILYGAPDSPTPTGSFPITQKSRDHVSNIFGSPMPFALRLTNDGVMVHASNVRSGWASNGCVGLPKDFARQLFDVVKLGDRVVITNGKPLLRVGDPLPVA